MYQEASGDEIEIKEEDFKEKADFEVLTNQEAPQEFIVPDILPNVDTSSSEHNLQLKEEKLEENKVNKSLVAAASSKNIEHLLQRVKKPNCDSLNRNAKCKQSLFSSGKVVASDESSDDSSDEVIPKQEFIKLKRDYDDYRANSCDIEQYRELKTKYKKLKSTHKEVLELNLQLQKKIIGMKNETPKSNLVSKPKNEVLVSPILTPKSFFTKPTNVNNETPSHSSFDGDQPSSVDSTKPAEVTPGKMSPNGNQLTVPHFVEDEFCLSKEKLLLARSVKSGRSGDSQFAKNLAAVFWSTEVLETRSVTGKKSSKKTRK